jgi:hypothetical protein
LHLDNMAFLVRHNLFTKIVTWTSKTSQGCEWRNSTKNIEILNWITALILETVNSCHFSLIAYFLQIAKNTASPLATSLVSHCHLECLDSKH